MKNLILVSLLAVIAPVLNGQISLVSWDFTGFNSSGNAPFSYAETAGNISSTDFVRGGGLGTRPSNNLFESRDWDGADAAGAVTNGDFVSFQVSVSGGLEMDFTQLSFYYTRDTSGQSGPTNLGVFTSVDNYAAAVDTVDISSAASGTNSFNLSSLAPQSDPVTIRIYGWGGASNGDLTFGANPSGVDLDLTGVIPEPSTYALIFGGVSLLGVLVWKRRARSKELAA